MGGGGERIALRRTTSSFLEKENKKETDNSGVDDIVKEAHEDLSTKSSTESY